MNNKRMFRIEMIDPNLIEMCSFCNYKRAEAKLVGEDHFICHECWQKEMDKFMTGQEKEMKVPTKELDKWEGFKEVVKPVMGWLKKNYHPHMTVIIDSVSAELVSGEMSFYDREEDNGESN